MRWRIGAVLVAGCGRIAFDPHADAGAPADSPDPATTFIVVAHVTSSCAILAGALSCWGNNASGQLATGDTMIRSAPTPIGTDTDWIAVAPGQDHICGIRGAGDLYCWGGNLRGQLGTGDFNPRMTPTRVTLPAAAIQLDAYFHTCAVLVDGSLYCWGRNDEGELGQNDLTGAADVPSPVPLGTLRYTQAGAGQGHTLVLADGALYGTGRNTDSEMGLGTGAAPQFRTLTALDPGPWLALAAGQSSSCGLRGNGDIACWGANDNAELGTSDMTNRDVPTTILTDQRALDTDTFHGCGLSSAHTLMCWGRNVEGQLGTGDQVTQLSPVSSSTFTDWIEVSAGRFHTCGMRADHSVWCVGQNTIGQLGVSGPMLLTTWTRVL